MTFSGTTSISTPILDTDLLDNSNDTIKYIKAFLFPHDKYSETQTTKYHLTTDLIAEAHATTAATTNVILPLHRHPYNPHVKFHQMII